MNSAPLTQAGVENGDITQRRKLAVVGGSNSLKGFELDPQESSMNLVAADSPSVEMSRLS